VSVGGRLRKVKMAQRKLHESANTLVDMAKVGTAIAVVSAAKQSASEFGL